MKILYDSQIFERHQFGGISRYFAEMVRHYAGRPDISTEVAVAYSDNEYLLQLPGSRKRIASLHGYYNDFLGGRRFRGRTRLLRLRTRLMPERDPFAVNRRRSIAALEAGDFDIFHPTYYETYFLDHLGGKPFVLTIHDMIPEIFCEYYPLDDPTVQQKRTLIEKATHVIAISEVTKRDLLAITQIPEERVSVVYHGTPFADAPFADGSCAGEPAPGEPASGEPAPSAPAPGGPGAAALPERFLLFVGNRTMYKNFYFFVFSIAGILARERGLHLVCTGSPFKDEELAFFDMLGIRDRVLHRYATEAELAQLYRKAAAFVFPSLYEGFGIPVLEAFACGCPALLARASALPEIGGDAAVYFEPKDAGSIREAVTRVLGDMRLCEELRARGRERIRQFSWRATAEKTEEVYRKVMRDRGASTRGR